MTKAVEQLKAVRKTKLFEQIAVQIQRLIEDGKLKHGDKLPTERELTGIFKVSRHSVREAIRVLEQQGLVKSRLGSGTYVVLDDEPTLAEYLTKAIDREKGKLTEIFQFRRMIEPQIAALAAENASEEDISELVHITDLQRQALNQPEEAVELDRRFHTALAAGTGSGVLVNIVDRINDILGQSRTAGYQTDIRRGRSLDGHDRIVAAVRASDPKEAAEAMLDHLTVIEQLVIHSME